MEEKSETNNPETEKTNLRGAQEPKHATEFSPRVLGDKKFDKILDKTLNFIFNKKEFVILLLILILAMTLRYFASINIEPNADEMVHGPHASGIIASGVIGRVWQSILWSYLTDFFQLFLGVTMFSTRFLSFLFGSLTAIVVYLLGKELFSKRVGLIAAFLIAISSFHILFTLIEMDIAAIFFVLLASLFFIKKLNKEGKISYLAAILIGIAALIKTLALFFVPAFIFAYMYHKKKIFNKEVIWPIFKFSLVILLVFSPIFIHNFLWYKDKQMVDAYFAQYFNIGEKARGVYEQAQGVHPGFKFKEIFTGSAEMLIPYIKTDPLISILGILGIIFFVLKKRKFAGFFALFQLIAFILITITNRLPTHYAVFPPVFALYAAAIIDHLAAKNREKISCKKTISIVLIVITIVNVYIMAPHIFQKSALTQMREYAIQDIGENDIVVADARIYRGRIMWMFLDKHYLESTLFPKLIEANNNLEGQEVQFNIYFVECIVDDCGWGTIKNQPDFNRSTEELVSFFKNNSREEVVFEGKYGNQRSDKQEPYFRVYKTAAYLKPQVLSAIDDTHEFFFYPALYKPKEKIFDSYEVAGPTESLLFLIAKIIIWASLIISLLAVASLFYLIYKSEIMDTQFSTDKKDF